MATSTGNQTNNNYYASFNYIGTSVKIYGNRSENADVGLRMDDKDTALSKEPGVLVNVIGQAYGSHTVNITLNGSLACLCGGYHNGGRSTVRELADRTC